MMDGETVEWWTTDHELIMDLADARGAEPMRELRDGDVLLRVEQEPEEAPGERITWGEFFDRFETQEKAFLFRSHTAAEGTGPDHRWDVIDRDSLAERISSSSNTRESESSPTNELALSDTGEGEPITFERTESETEPETEPQAPGTSATGDQARADDERYEALVLDAVSEGGGALSAGTDEYVSFENAGERPLDLSGVTIRNEVGRSYEVDDAVLDPGERFTLHTGEGTDSETERYWDANGTVWQDGGDTVVVTSPSGDRIVEEPYKGGR